METIALAWTLSISSLFLIPVLLTYCLLPEKRHWPQVSSFFSFSSSYPWFKHLSSKKKKSNIGWLCVSLFIVYSAAWFTSLAGYQNLFCESEIEQVAFSIL